MTVRVEVDGKSGLHRVFDEQGKPVEQINAFLEALSTRGLSPLTVRAYAYDLVAVHRWLEATARQLEGITQTDLLDFVAWDKARGARPRSINRRLTVCRLLVEFWQLPGLDSAPGTSLPAPHYRGPGRDRRLGLHVLSKRAPALRVKEPRTLVTPLTAEQVRYFLRGLRRHRDIAIVHLMLLCGLRSREVLGLEHKDIALTERTVRVLGKGAVERVVPLADMVASAIEQYLAHERPRPCLAPALFVCLQGHRRGHAMTPAGLRSLFRHRRHKLELPQANAHRFRHTFGADMARSGLPLPVIQKLMGHANPEMTLQYINLSMADIAQAYHEATARIRDSYRTE